MYCLVCTPSVKMALVQCCRDTSYLSVAAPLLFFSGRDCNKMMGRAAAGGLPRTRQINGINYMELLREAHQIPNQQPLSHRCEHRHPARRSELKEDKVNGDPCQRPGAFSGQHCDRTSIKLERQPAVLLLKSPMLSLSSQTAFLEFLLPFLFHTPAHLLAPYQPRITSRWAA